MKIYSILVAVLMLYFGFLTADAHAYIDPGTGSYFMQLIIGIFVGAGCAIKIFWNNLKVFFSNIFKSKK